MIDIHPAAEEFPLMDKPRLDELIADIKEHGQREPITLCDGMILDGRNRAIACESLGIEPMAKQFSGNPWTYVWSLNGARRDLVAEQRYLIWKHCIGQSESWQKEQQRIADEANEKRSAAAKERARTDTGTFEKQESPVVRHNVAPLDSVPPLLDKEKHKTPAAKAFASKTNLGAVNRGDALASRRPDLAEQVRKGDITPAKAQYTMKREAITQQLEAAKLVPPATLVTGPYHIIVADPPWEYDFSATESREIENQYPTATLDTICSHIPDAADGCALFLWVTAPKLVEGLQVMLTWGFIYKTCAVWDKEKMGMGYWFRSQHELILVGTKGQISPPADFLRIASVIRAPRGVHSQKPDALCDYLDAAYPGKAKLEMYSRSQRDGWAAWGNQV